MFQKPNNLLNGDFIGKTQCRLINRTGATLTNGDMVAFNLDFAAVSGQAMVGLDIGTDTDSAAGYVLGAACSPTTEKNARFMAVVEDPRGSIADNDEGLFCLSGIVQCKQNGANAGEFLTGTNAQVYATPLTLTEILALTTSVKIVGISLEASSGAQVKKCIFDGIHGFNFAGGDT